MKTQSEQKGVSEGESQRYVLRVDRGRVAQRLAGHCREFNYIRVQETDNRKPEAKGHGGLQERKKREKKQ